jgi:hypothetical protein
MAGVGAWSVLYLTRIENHVFLRDQTTEGSGTERMTARTSMKREIFYSLFVTMLNESCTAVTSPSFPTMLMRALYRRSPLNTRSIAQVRIQRGAFMPLSRDRAKVSRHLAARTLTLE